MAEAADGTIADANKYCGTKLDALTSKLEIIQFIMVDLDTHGQEND